MVNRSRHSRKSDESAKVAINAFGGLSVFFHGLPVTIVWGSQKARLLFCCLLVTYDQWIHRDKLIEILWPGCETAAGVNNFKTTLSRLRKSFSGAHAINPVITQGEAVRINSAQVTLDASDFRANATAGIKMYARGDLKTARQLLEKAQDFYTGAFLPEEPFNGYLTGARMEYADLNSSVITTLGRIYQTEGNQDALDAIRLLTKAVPHPAANPA